MSQFVSAITGNFESLLANEYVFYAQYALALVGLWLVRGAWRKWTERVARERLLEAGSSEPPSLHPVISAEKCIGCGACTKACPEGKIIGMIGGKAQLLDPTSCIGHGACKTSCPADAIDLVFGSARRGVDIPIIKPNFESATVDGLYIAGELGGMGLIANAIEQGRQAVEMIARRDDLKQEGSYDVVIVGAGPAGISASLAAQQKGLRFLTLEQDTLGGAVAHYPRAKLVMTRPAMLPGYGKVRLRRVPKEKLLVLWNSVLHKAKLGKHLIQKVRVLQITPRYGGFDIATSRGPVASTTVLLATGRRGSPRRLDVPGEHLSKVVYSLDEPTQYHGRHVLIVGGGDSALETAIELARHPLASLTLMNRGDAFDRARPASRQALESARRAGRLRVVMSSHVCSIAAEHVVIEQHGRSGSLPNDAVIVCAGGELPTALLIDTGVKVETKYGTA